MKSLSLIWKNDFECFTGISDVTIEKIANSGTLHRLGRCNCH